MGSCVPITAREEGPQGGAQACHQHLLKNGGMYLIPIFSSGTRVSPSGAESETPAAPVATPHTGIQFSEP